MTLDVYTDGASSPDGWGGWAWTDGRRSGYGGERFTTNQRMEMTAVLKAVEAHPDQPIRVHSDSAYVINCFLDRWYDRWVANGWRNGRGHPVFNRDLWEPLIAAVEAADVTFVKVKGHSGNPLNEEADRLAVAAKERARVLG